MLKRALQAVVIVGFFGLLFGSIQQQWTEGTDQEARAGRSVLALVTPAFAQGNQPPNANAGLDRTVAIGETVVLDGSGSTEPEGKAMDFLWAITSVPAGSLAALDDPTAVRPSFAADVAGDYAIELIVSEGPRDSTPDSVTISTVNSAPLAEAGRDRAIAAGQTVRLDGGASFDFDGDALSYAWILTSRPVGSAAVLDDPSAVQPSFMADVAGDYAAELTVSDGALTSAPAAVIASATNVAPFADAGLDQSAVVGQRVELDAGRVSDAEGDELAIDWSLTRRPPGSAAKLSTPAADRPSFLVDVPGLYMVQLDATDGPADSVPDTSAITTGNTAPTADAGPDQAIAAGELVTLDGGGSSDIDGDALSYRWALLSAPAGSAANLDQPSAVRPELTADLAGTYVAQLAVDDGVSQSRPDTVILSTGNVPPVADSGPDQTVAAGGLAQFDGSGSFDRNLDALTFAWSIPITPNGSSVALSDPTAIDPSFTLDKPGIYFVQLIVSDGQQNSVPNNIVITSGNSRPLAEAGPDRGVIPNSLVQLDGGASSDPDNDPLTQRWALLSKPAGSTAALSDPTAISPTFTADVIGTYVAQLIVGDGTLDSEPDTVVIETVNTAPTADAGPDQAVTAGDQVVLDGFGSSDPDNDPLIYAWSLIAKPAGSTAGLTAPTDPVTLLITDKPGTYVVELTVNDGLAPSAPDQVTITAANRAPLANAGPDQSVTAGNTVQLDGSGSGDADMDPITYAWSLVSTPADSAAVLTDPTLVNPSFVTDTPGSYTVELIVNDGTVDSVADPVTVTANPVTAVNSAPVLAAIGDLNVDLGATLNLDLAATDVNGDQLAFSASPLPLPNGANLDGISGAFTFTPDSTQVGDIALTFIVSDGLATDSESILITVAGAPMGGVTAVAGRLLDANDASLGVETPIVGATVSLLNDTATTTSDVNGDFLLSGVPAGGQVLAIDSSTATAAPDGSIYASFREELTLIAEVTNVIGRDIFLPRVDPDGTVFIDELSTTTTMVENPTIGVSFEVPPDTAFNEDGSELNGDLSISEVDIEFAPMELPEGFQPAMLISIQPTGVTFTQPLAITFPNSDNLPPGSEVDIYSLDADSGAFTIVGIGTVSADGSIIETTSGGIVAATWHFPLAPRPGADGRRNNDENQDPNKCVTCSFGSSTHANSSNLTEDHSLASYRSLNQPRSLRFVYNSTSADPRPIIVTETTIPRRSAVPNTISTRLSVAGIDQGEELHTATAGLSESIDETIHQAVQFDAGGFATGRYPYSLMITNNFDISSVGAIQTGNVLVNNESASPFGAGWTLDGLERLHLKNNGSRATLTRGDGSALFFRNATVLDLNGSLVQIAAPVSVAAQAEESDLEIRVFEESNQRTLAASVDVDDITPSGALVPRAWPDVPAGITVNSHLIHFDPLGTAGNVTLTGTLIFSSDILGVIFTDATLDASDTALGDPGTVYPTAGARGVDGGDTIVLGADLRTLTVTLQDGGGLDQIRVITAGASEIQVESRFDTNTEGWLEIGATDLTYQATGGNPGGHLRARDVSNNIWQWVAPAKFRGDISAAYNGTLSYDLNQSLADAQFPTIDITIIGAGLTLTYITPYNPGTNWTHHNAVLNEDAGWVVSGQSRAPTQSEFQAVLGAVTALHIRGEFRTGSDSGRLDNVVLRRPAAGAVTTNTFATPPGNFSALLRNPDDSFTRTLKNGTAIEYDAAGFMTASVDRNGNATSYAYDGGGLLTAITDPVGLVTNLAYTGGLLSSVTGPANRVTAFAHDGAGDLTSITDPDLSVRLFAYDANHLITSQTSKRGFVTTYDYGFHGRSIQSNRPDATTRQIAPSEVVGLIDAGGGLGTEANPAPFVRPDQVVATYTDGNGNTTTFGLNRFGSRTSTTDGVGAVTARVRDANNKTTRIVMPEGRVTEMTFDSRGNRLSRRKAAGTALEQLTTFEYEPVFNKVTKVIDPALNETTFAYDANGNLLTRSDALTQTASFTYDPRGLVLTSTDRNGEFTTYTYDANGNLDTVTDAELNVTDLTHDLAGNVTQIVQGLGTPEARTTITTFDARNRVLTATDGAGGITTFRYDAAGNIEELENATGQIESRTYDPLNRVTEVNNPASGITTTAYDGNGNATSVTDALSNVTTFEYDGANRVTKQIDALLNERLFAYDLEDNVTSVTDARGQVTTFVYDILDRVEQRTNPVNDAVSFTYDSRNNPITTTDPKGQVATSSYDALNRLTQISTLDNVIVLGHDAEGNVTSVADDDSELSFTHDGLNRILTAATGLGGVQPLVTLTNAFDAVGNRISLADDGGVSGAITGFAHDGAGRLTQLTTPASQPIGLVYDPAGRITGLTFPNTVTTTVSYDPLTGRLAQLTHTAGATPLADFGYDYNGLGNVTQIAELTQTRNFAYDDLQRLTAGGTAGAPETYAYDEEGNRTASHLSAGHVTDAASRLTEDDTFIYAYDLNGNLTSKTAKAGGAVTAYIWDAQNQLTRIDFPDLTFAAYRYDGLGRRIEKDASGAVTQYVYDGSDILLEYDGAGALLARYSHGQGVDQPLAVARDLDASGVFEASEQFYYQADHQGSIRALTDAGGAVANSYDYDSYGNIEAATEILAQPYTYTGRELDAESGLYYYRARYYDPATGRFLNEDPLGFSAGDTNLYRYVFNNPVNLNDPFGLEVTVVCRPIRNLGLFKHCSVFVWHRDCDGNVVIDAQYSVPLGRPDPLPQGSEGNETFDSDREAFDNPGGDNEHYPIEIPDGMTGDQFDAEVMNQGKSYRVEYDLGGPNSNTATDNIVERAGGTMPDVTGAVGQNFGEGGPLDGASP